MVITIAIASAAIGLVLLLYLLWTQRRRYKQARSLAEETARQLLEIERASKIGHWFLDEAAQTTAWSAQMFELVGIPPKPALSVEEAQAFLHPEDITAFLAACRQAIATRTTARVEARWVRADGELRWVQNELTRNTMPTGNISVYSGRRRTSATTNAPNSS
jgi:PAS domain-containing protein